MMIGGSNGLKLLPSLFKDCHNQEICTRVYAKFALWKQKDLAKFAIFAIWNAESEPKYGNYGFLKICTSVQIKIMRNYETQNKMWNFAFAKFCEREITKMRKFLEIKSFLHNFRFRRTGFWAFRKNPSVHWCPCDSEPLKFS